MGVSGVSKKALACGLLLLSLLLLAYGCFLLTDQPSSPMVPVGSQRPLADTVAEAAEIEEITFTGFGRVEVSASKPGVEFTNPASNKCAFRYLITDDESGGVIATIDVVNPGEYAYVNVFEFYQEEGAYDLTVQISPITSDGQALNGMTQHVQVVVTK